MEVLTYEAYCKMGLKEQALKKANPLCGLANKSGEVKRCITLPVTLEDGEHMTM